MTSRRSTTGLRSTDAGSSWCRAVLLAVSAASALACANEPRSSPAASTPSPPVPSAPSAQAVARTAPQLPPSAAAASTAAVETPAPSSAPSSSGPLLFAPDGGLFEQTRDLPSIESPQFKHKIDLLFRAIVLDEPSVAHPAFFPLPAYEKVKAAKDPATDYRRRLLVNFDRDIHAYHKQFGARASEAELLGIEVQEKRARWMDPGSEYNRIGYYRVLRSELRCRDAEGRPRNLPVLSMISWRGEWYFVHLSSFA